MLKTIFRNSALGKTVGVVGLTALFAVTGGCASFSAAERNSPNHMQGMNWMQSADKDGNTVIFYYNDHGFKYVEIRDQRDKIIHGHEVDYAVNSGEDILAYFSETGQAPCKNQKSFETAIAANLDR